MSNSVRPHKQQPTRLARPWDSPGKSTGVGCHFLLQCMKVKSESEVAQSCPTLGDPMDCSLPGSSVHGIFQARVLEWGAIAFSVCLNYDSSDNSSKVIGCLPSTDKLHTFTWHSRLSTTELYNSIFIPVLHILHCSQTNYIQFVSPNSSIFIHIYSYFLEYPLLFCLYPLTFKFWNLYFLWKLISALLHSTKS